MSLPAPAKIIAAIDQDAASLDEASKLLYSAILERSEATRSYEMAMGKALIALRDEYKQSGERMPAEDLRKAIAHSRIPDKTYATYLTSTAKVDAMTARTRAITAAMNGRQSVLSALKEELRAVS